MLNISYILFYGSYLIFLLIFYIIYRLVKKKKFSKPGIILFILSIFFIYIRFVEPNIILVKEEKIKVGFNANLVVISDIHLGFFKNKYFLERVVSKINKFEDVDAVIIPGDFLYNYSKDINLEDLFSPLKKIKVPIYATFGNYDTGYPGTYLKNKLISTLKNNNVILLENKAKRLKNKNLILVGLGANAEKRDKKYLFDKFKKSDNLISITHNPDTVIYYETNDKADLTITGYTHGGQVRIPFIYKFFIPTKGDFDEGIYEIFGNKIYVSSGLGEVLVPMRFAVFPKIYKLKLR